MFPQDKWINIKKVPQGVALRLRQICDTDSTFKVKSNNIYHQQYFIARGYEPQNVSKQFSDFAKSTTT